MEIENRDNLSFNYLDIFFSCYFNKDIKCTPMIRDHTLVYVYSGELLIQENNKRTVIHSGECVFLRRNNRVSMTKQPRGDEYFKAIFMIFKRNFLREFYQTIDKKILPLNIEKHKPSVIKLPATPDITGLFQSMTPYFNSSVQPAKELMELKLEGRRLFIIKYR